MRDVNDRLHRIKLILTGLGMGLLGGGLIVVGNRAASLEGWIGVVPWSEFGGVLLGAGLLGIWLDSFFKREEAAADERRLRRVLADHAPEMRDAVLAAFAADHADLARVSPPETLDRIATNALALRLDDAEFASEVFGDIRSQAIQSTERWHDVQLAVTLTPLADSPAYYDVTMRWEYDTSPVHINRWFFAVSDRTEYDELAGHADGTSAWYLKPDPVFDARHHDAYELLQFSVNGQPRPIRRSSRSGFQAYAVNLGLDDNLAGRLAHISYTLRTITPRSGNLLFFDIEQPTRNLSISVDYTDTDIASVTAIDLVPAGRQIRREHSPPSAATRTLHIEVDGWIFPRAGVAVVWSADANQTTRLSAEAEPV